MSGNTFKWKNGARVKVPAHIAGAIFDEIIDEKGHLDPEEIVARAKDKDSPLHDEFEWNNNKAAKAYRLQQAQYLSRSILRLQVQYDNKPPLYTRMVESINVPSSPKEKQEPKRIYLRTEEILADQAARHELLMSAVKDAIAYRKRYAVLSELTELIHVMDDTIERLG